MSAVVVPVALVLGTVILCVDSCSVELIVLPLAIVGVVSSVVFPSLLSFTVPFTIRYLVLATVELAVFLEFHFVCFYFCFAFVEDICVNLWALTSRDVSRFDLLKVPLVDPDAWWVSGCVHKHLE